MDKEKLKRQILDQSGEAFRAFLARSVVAIIEYQNGELIGHGSGTCVYYRGRHLIMTAGHVIENVPRENLSLVYKRWPSDQKIPIESVYHRIDRTTRLDVGLLVLSADVARFMGKTFLTEEQFEVAPKNLATDLVALNGFPEGLFEHAGEKYYKFGAFTFITVCEEVAKWHQPINSEIQIEFGYPDIVTDAQTNQPYTLPKVSGMSGGGMWVLNINPKGISLPESSRLVGITNLWSPKREYVRGNKIEHWLRFADETFGANLG